MACVLAAPAAAQDRSSDNAVTEAEDGFGYSVGREVLGIYNGGNVRGFSPTAAGNVRIDGLYFDPAFDFPGLLTDSTGIKVGLSAQGYPFAAPSGIVDIALRRPGDKAGASVVVNGDSFGSAGMELTGSAPLGQTLGLAYGANVSRTGYPDGTDSISHSESLALRWRPAPGIELLPFYARFDDYNDEAGPFYIAAGNYLPPVPAKHTYLGPHWADYRLIAQSAGLLTSITPARGWAVRLGLFRSSFKQREGYFNLLTDVAPDGSATRLLFADPPLHQRSLSGELRVSHSVPDGPRLHVLHLSLRSRDARSEFGGSQEFDLGPTTIYEEEDAARPASFTFGPVSRERVRQDMLGLAYSGRWRNVGELGLGLSKVRYRKTTQLPGVAPIVGRDDPWLYNVNAAVSVAQGVSLFAGYARGLEESGTAPPNAANRNAPLPAILTSQKDAGLRWAITPRVKLIAGVFELSKPYFGFDSAQAFRQVGSIRNRGAEFSLSGPLTARLDLVAGGVVLDAQVQRDAGATGTIGRRPVGVAKHLFNVNLNWRTPWAEGLSFDASVLERGAMPATTDNSLEIVGRQIVNLGARYSFKVAGKAVTARVQIYNVLDQYGLVSGGPGLYRTNQPRSVNGFLAVDF
ncbi:TonB-dependent siderophore receptor [Novosphingobium sp.]|uniref:TonB-dependent siderophore receptor n=1 Tax=Novosphingobium sp. TaxID=1874826 RepID=UPI0025EF5599|nr:TonB-dependent receptor [Novosphingobium sp.]